MPTITMAAKQLKNRTGDAFRAVLRGDRVVLTRRGKPVALIVPLAGEAPEVPAFDEAWAEIEAALAASEPHYRSPDEAVAATRNRV